MMLHGRLFDEHHVLLDLNGLPVNADFQPPPLPPVLPDAR